MNPSLQPLPFDPSSLAGLSAALLASHHQNNYGGAVKRLGALRDQLRSISFDQAPGFQINGLDTDPLEYSLSSDGSQIVLGYGLPADAIITANYLVSVI
jgi:hypothetical protein